MLWLWIVLGVVVLSVVALVLLYNRLVRLRNRVDNAWAQVDVQLKRRYDLIPNLVETVKGYAAHEKGTLEAVIDARSRAINAQGAGPAARAEAEAGLAGALKSLFALSESYPQLQAAGNFRALQDSLGSIEEAVQNARRYYNAVVRDYNTRIHTVPSNVVAGAFGFQPREFFEIATAEREAPRVSF